MTSNWVNSLDALAAGGVIDFDAAAFLLDKKPRYVGHPDMEKLPTDAPMYFPNGITYKDLPQDIYDKHNDNLVENPKWKKIMFAIIAVIGVTLGTVALAKLNQKMSSGFKKVKFPKLLDMSKIKITIMKPLNWVKGKLKRI